MKVNRPIRPLFSRVASCRGLAPAFAVLLAAGLPARADHFYNAWTEEFNAASTHAEEARAVVTDSHGNVYVAGESFNSNNIREWYIAKYDALDGHLLKTAALGPNNAGLNQSSPIGDSFVTSMAVDSQDNIIVAGGTTFSVQEGEDIEVIKFDSNLNQLWARIRVGGNHGLDEAKKVVIGPSDAVFVVGRSEISGNGTNMVTLKYSSSGTLSSSVTYNSSGNIDDIPVGLAVTSDGGFWVTGYSVVSGTKVTHTLQYDNTFSLQHDFSHSVTGGDSTPAGIVVDSADSAFITTTDIDSSNNHLIFTGKYAIGVLLWSDSFSHTQGDEIAQATGIAIGPDGNPVVTGTVDAGDNFSITQAAVLKYHGTAFTTNPPMWTAIDSGFSPEDAQHPGFPAFNTASTKVHVDAASNVIITGTSQPSDDTNPEIYVAKFNGADGTRFFASGFDGSSDTGTDFGVDVTTDIAGNIALCGTEARVIPPGNSPNASIHGIITQKYQRIIAETNDPLPPDGATPRKLTLMDAPALADTGDLTSKITFTEGKTKLGAILKQNGAGASQLVAIQKQDAPNVSGATFASFGDPLISPDGHIAFPAKLGGVPGNKSSTVWTTLSGSLTVALQQGAPVPGLSSVNVATIMNLSLRNGQLLALLKVTGTANQNVVLMGLDGAGNGTKLLRTNDAVTVDGKSSTVKTITVLAPPPNEAGAGNWQGDGNAVAKAVLADKRTVIFKLSSNGAQASLFASGGDATVVTANATWKTFAFPAVAPNGGHFATLGTLNADKTHDITTKGDTAIVYSPNGSAFSLIAREGSPFTGIANTSYSVLSNPLTSSSGQTAFLATLESTPGSNVKLLPAGSHVVVQAVPNNATVIARSGDTAPAPPGDPATATFSSFTSLAMLSGSPTSPLFIAKLAGKGVSGKNNVAVFARDSTATLRRLLCKGDQLGSQTVTGFTLLNATPQAFTAARSFNGEGGVAFLVTFSDHTTGILELTLP